ncbi:carboxyl transferase domain-containing protein [Actinoplanes awajinensis]|uniref:Acetyl-CoA carboxylase carboxyltransferase subunit n=1 Tax=Actinoplanes awajinensis subsp. mycoplanecinus TaxID=135947 RepID=A0A117MPC0_9ACTN|nr:carboxyl transferase domain-containing protein [Actinoplanes awajinensis]KUL28389.1 acetyl-CoA carboxylase carboxyltransferase subunit [Actinoplanes awajinensis subsp. mycoplanecinus]
MTVLGTTLDPRDPAYLEGRSITLQRLAVLEAALDEARAGGGEKWVTRHHARGKLLPRERIEMLLDQDSPFLELSPVAAWGSEFPVGASVVTGIGVVEDVECVVIANDPTVDGGAVNPYTAEKIRRAARIASENRLPLVNLVESTGAAAPAGSIARELSRLTADRVPTVCVVFGATSGDAAYLPALSDYTIVVRGHAKVLTIHPQRSGVEVRATPVVPAGPAGPADQLAEDERDGLRLARQCVRRFNWRKQGPPPRTSRPPEPRYDSEALLSLAAADPAGFDPREVLARFLDGSDFDEFKPGPDSALVAGWGELHGYPIGVLCSPGVWLSPDESQKAVHFLQLANATATPVIFLRHPGELPGSDDDGDGDADVRHDAPLVHAVAKSTVPHLVLTIGPEPGGTPARADEPRFQFSWPRPPAEHAAADDGVIDPRDTRTVLGLCLSAVHSAAVAGAEHVGVFRP